METNTNYRAVSEFDMGISILIRIDNILTIITDARLTNDFKLWRDCLMAVSGEIEDLYNDKEEEKFTSLLSKVNPLISKSVPRVAFGQTTPRMDLTTEEFNDLYLKMRELDKFVRGQLNQRNMLLRKKGDASRASGRMS